VRIIGRTADMKSWSRTERGAGRTIGFVPTMGYLHEGHLELVRLARRRADRVVVSIFVNPTQFGPDEDLARYPRDLERDAALLRGLAVDVLFHPTDPREIYPDGFQTAITVTQVSKPLCGASRPVHFGGVATVCCKLFNIVRPHLAVFGEKDYQQLLVVRRMVTDLDLDVEIVAGATVREPDGLAMSSRNKYLTPEQRVQAVALRRSLDCALQLVQNGERRRDAILAAVRGEIGRAPLGRIDYAEIRDLPDLTEAPDTLVGDHLLALAVFFGQTRLIDNQVLQATTTS
jgi:pantoate--beta-alanine ligase